MSTDLPAMAPSDDVESEVLVFRRHELYELLGKWGLPPWRDVAGTPLGGDVDCALLAQEMIADVERIRLRRSWTVRSSTAR